MCLENGQGYDLQQPAISSTAKRRCVCYSMQMSSLNLALYKIMVKYDFSSASLQIGVRPSFSDIFCTYITKHIAQRIVIAQIADFAKMLLTLFARGCGFFLYFLYIQYHMFYEFPSSVCRTFYHPVYIYCVFQHVVKGGKELQRG